MMWMFSSENLSPWLVLSAAEHLLDLGQDLALAHRAALVRAVVLVGVELAVDAEHADLEVALGDDLAIALAEFGFLAHVKVRHVFFLLRALFVGLGGFPRAALLAGWDSL